MAEPRWPSIVLGSASPRRADLLAALGVPVRVEPIDIDEDALVANDGGVAVVERIARAKFANAEPSDGELLLTADTMVACNEVLLGKPTTDADVESMLQQMSDQQLVISTAVCVGRRGDVPRVEVVSTQVQLGPISSAEIADYVATGVGLDKAGGLALQSEANGFIAHVDGCWSNVLGLPMCAVSLLLGQEADRPAQLCTPTLCGDAGR